MSCRRLSVGQVYGAGGLKIRRTEDQEVDLDTCLR
jgi:hypothetical protein